VSRVKPPRRPHADRNQHAGGSSKDLLALKERDDPTFPNLEDCYTPNKAGFDSLESVLNDHSKLDLKPIELLPQTSVS